jgi:hypothetical protein
MSPGSPDFSVALGYGKSSSQALSASYAAAGWEHLVSLQPAPRDFAELSKIRLSLAVLATGGENAYGSALG